MLVCVRCPRFSVSPSEVQSSAFDVLPRRIPRCGRRPVEVRCSLAASLQFIGVYAAIGYRSSAMGHCWLRQPVQRTFHPEPGLLKCTRNGSTTTCASGTSRSLSPLPARTVMISFSRSTSFTRNRSNSISRNPLPNATHVSSAHRPSSCANNCLNSLAVNHDGTCVRARAR
jgi:hypothetical protein